MLLVKTWQMIQGLPFSVLLCHVHINLTGLKEVSCKIETLKSANPIILKTNELLVHKIGSNVLPIVLESKG